VLLRSLGRAQANDSGWPTVKGKYLEYPKFKEWWAYRRSNHSHMKDKLTCWALKDKCLSGGVKAMVGDIEDLDEVRDTLDTCYDRPEKYIAAALDPIINFCKYKAFRNKGVLLLPEGSHDECEEGAAVPQAHQRPNTAQHNGSDALRRLDAMGNRKARMDSWKFEGSFLKVGGSKVERLAERGSG
jgi:hypothetical protein